MRTELERTVQPSILDRLTDLEPGAAADPRPTFERSAREFRQSVERDLEWLLNTRRTIVPVPAHCVEVHRSAFAYGLPDTTGVAVGTTAGRDRLLAQLQDTIERFEPRLGSPRVRLAEMGHAAAPQVRFTVEATLRMNPGAEHVLFDTVLEVARAKFEVTEPDAPDAFAPVASA